MHVVLKCIVDREGQVLADSQDHVLGPPIEFTERTSLFAQKKAHQTLEIQGAPMLVAHAQSPGFETYRTGWHSLILEKLSRSTAPSNGA